MQTPFKQQGRITIGSDSVGRVRRCYPVAATLSPLPNLTGRAHGAPQRGVVDAQALRAFAANGFGDAVVDTAAAYKLPDSFELYKQARARRSQYLREIIGAAVKAVADQLRATLAQWQRRQHARGTYLALSALDARTLRDLGLHRSEIRSVASELAGDADSSRVRFMPVRRVTTLSAS